MNNELNERTIITRCSKNDDRLNVTFLKGGMTLRIAGFDELPHKMTTDGKNYDRISWEEFRHLLTSLNLKENGSKNEEAEASQCTEHSGYKFCQRCGEQSDGCKAFCWNCDYEFTPMNDQQNRKISCSNVDATLAQNGDDPQNLMRHGGYDELTGRFVAPYLWREDGERFSLNHDGTYTMDKNREAQPTCFYTYSYKRLMDTGAFTLYPPASARKDCVN